jgi:hypothetical protein
MQKLVTVTHPEMVLCSWWISAAFISDMIYMK